LVNIVYSRDDGVGEPEDHVLDTVGLPTLAPGETYSRVMPLQIAVDVLNDIAQADDPPGQGVGYVSANTNFIGMVIDPNGAVIESSATEGDTVLGIDGDDITYFPWDIDGDGLVSATDAIYIINRLGQSTSALNQLADLDGSGTIESTDAIAAINRLGYQISPVDETPAAPQRASSSAAMQNYMLTDQRSQLEQTLENLRRRLIDDPDDDETIYDIFQSV
jgi:hypothetical protein